jgi:hypothetical protein
VGRQPRLDAIEICQDIPLFVKWMEHTSFTFVHLEKPYIKVKEAINQDQATHNTTDK